MKIRAMKIGTTEGGARASGRVGLLVAALALAGAVDCGDGGGDGDAWAQPDTRTDTDVTGGGFDDHTQKSFADAGDFLSFAGTSDSPAQVKFVLTTFQADSSNAYFMDPSFYALHDEWYWFRLLNGAPIENVDVEPIEGKRFETIDEVYGAYSGTTSDLPLDLRFVDGDRLYSPRFYELALGNASEGGSGARELAIGSLLRYPADPDRVRPEELWLFELEYVDVASEALLLRILERLRAALPSQIGDQLRWLARPAIQQEALVAELRAGGGPLASRCVLYEELVVPGEVDAYNPGIVAGRISRFPVGTLGGASVGPEDIVVTAEVPDYLPPVAAIVSAVPQTPLAHLNLLAKARGTPNAYAGGILDDALLQDWAYYRTPVILEVGEQSIRWAPITELEYQKYRKKLGIRELSVEQVDLSAAPYVVDLTEGSIQDQKGLVPLTGGKSAGFLALGSVEGLEIPYAPVAVTIRGYREHIASFVPMIEQILAAPAFVKDARARFVVLEGLEDFEAEHGGDEKAMTWLAGFIGSHPKGTWLGNVVEAGGLKAIVRAKPLDPDIAALVQAALEERYADLAVSQGLRFRSSSTAEDVEGFNGAGLYDSNTGFLYPELQASPKDKDHSVEWALKKTWASYWTFEAFEERRVAGVDHLSGNMGVLVHPRFDDSMELSNGVVTFTVALRDGGADLLEMVVNVQDGSLSVTNPEPGNPAKPEIDRVVRLEGGELLFERVQASSEVPAGTWILSQTDLAEVFEDAEAVSLAWLAQANEAWPLAERSSTIVLDFEVKEMAAGWPAFADGVTMPERLVFKQARTLSRPVTITQAELKGEAVPRDLLSMTVRVQERTCTSADVMFRTMELYTDPTQAHLLDHAALPFAAYVAVRVSKPGDGWGVKPGVLYKATHNQLLALERPGMPESGWSVRYTVPAATAKAWGFTTFSLNEAGEWSMLHDGNAMVGAGVICQVEDLVVGAGEYLSQLLQEKLQ